MVEFIGTTVSNMRISAIDVCFKYKDVKIGKELYDFLNKRLENYNLYLDDECRMTSETMYDESSEILIIGVTIIAPLPPLTHDDTAETTKKVLVHKKGFQKFYEDEKKFFSQINHDTS